LSGDFLFDFKNGTLGLALPQGVLRPAVGTALRGGDFEQIVVLMRLGSQERNSNIGG